MNVRVIHTEVVATKGADGKEFMDTVHALDGSFTEDEKIVVISERDYQRLLYLTEESNVPIPWTWTITDWWKKHGPDTHTTLPLSLTFLVIVGYYVYTAFQ